MTIVAVDVQRDWMAFAKVIDGQVDAVRSVRTYATNAQIIAQWMVIAADLVVTEEPWLDEYARGRSGSANTRAFGVLQQALGFLQGILWPRIVTVVPAWTSAAAMGVQGRDEAKRAAMALLLAEWGEGTQHEADAVALALASHRAANIAGRQILPGPSGEGAGRGQNPR